MASHSASQRLALAICDFLSTSLADSTVPADDRDSLDIAINLIGECFKVDPTDKAAVADAVRPHPLLALYTQQPAAAAASTAGVGRAASSPSEAHKAEAETLKSRGNAAVAAKDYAGAIELYTQALALAPANAVYLSNRAAAHSAACHPDLALADAEAATAADPTYSKGWSRLGLARFNLGDARGARDAYAAGIDAETAAGAVPSDAMRRGLDTATKRALDLDPDTGADSVLPPASTPAGMPSLAGLASMLGGGGAGGGGGGGGPDLSSLSGMMSNPAFASMAQNMMSNPGLMSNLMSNPRLREMANQFSSGGGMPDVSTLLSDPSIADLARLMGGPGAGRGSGGPGAGPGHSSS